jgi:hypothetical protein
VALSPFVYELPVQPEDVIGRDAELGHLRELAEAGRFARVVAPRRYGKTSLLHKLLAERASDGVPGVLVDFYGAVSVTEATHRIERAYARWLHGPVRRAAERYFTASGLGLSLGAFGISITLERSRNPDPMPALHALLDLPLRVLARTGVIPIVVFDEFQGLLPIAGIDAVIRSQIQHHGNRVSYVFCGSEPGMMRELFESRSRPLYGQAIPLRLGRLRASDLASHVTRRFDATGKDAGEALAPLLSAARGHPQRSMLLAHHLWQQTPANGTVDDETWERAIGRADREVEGEFRALWRSMDMSELRALRALTISGGAPYRASVLSSVELRKSTARDAYERLIDRGEIERSEDGDALLFVDPLFERWVRTTT